MNNFNFSMTTEIIFGENRIDTLSANIKKHTEGPILVTYGGGSVKAIGLYDNVINELKANNIEFFELGGIKPNPEVDTCEAGVKIIKENNIEFLLSLGGGSVLDNTKHMSICSKSDRGVWETLNDYAYTASLTNLPKVGCVITLAATGSENNAGGVISNPEINVKRGFGHPEVKPVFAYEDPTLLNSLPEYQKRAGVSDILSHLFEQYFGNHSDDMLTDRLIEAQVKNVIDNYEKYISENDYSATGEIFVTSSLALNGLTSIGKSATDWLSHQMEHEVSAYTDLTHGIGLAIIHPAVIRYYFENDVKNNNSLIKYENLAKHVFFITGENKCEKAVEKVEELFYNVSNVKKLSDVEIFDFDGANSAKKILDAGFKSQMLDLTVQDLTNIYNNIK